MDDVYYGERDYPIYIINMGLFVPYSGINYSTNHHGLIIYLLYDEGLKVR